MAYRGLGRDADARAVLKAIHADMEILENTSYHLRLLMYKGERAPEQPLAPEGASALDLATQGYGVGNRALCNGDSVRAREIFAQIAEGTFWPAFGFIAAECDLYRMR